MSYVDLIAIHPVHLELEALNQHTDYDTHLVNRKIKNFVGRVGKSYMGLLGVVGAILLLSVIVLQTTSVTTTEQQNVQHNEGRFRRMVPIIPTQTEGENTIEKLIDEEKQKHDKTLETFNIVETPLGKVQGNAEVSRDGRTYYSFYKIPYAKPPVGDRRFRSPEPAERWEGILNETVVATQCIQKNKYAPTIAAVGAEDCLYLNIYSPKLPENPEEGTDLLPTLFYIHGGGFLDGNGSRYGPPYFMDEDVVLLTFQYRIGPFGFLNTGDGQIAGNMGLKDQVMALKWVKENIKYFGGDPNRVTIFGNSAGGVSVSTHMFSPMSAGLFHSAIAQSGVIGIGTMNQTEHIATVHALGRELGCITNTSIGLVTCIKDADARHLAVIRAEDISYGPTIELVHNPEDLSDVFIPEDALNLYNSGKVNKVPLIVGINSAEALASSIGILTNQYLVTSLNENWNEVAPEIFGYGNSASNSDEMSTKIRDFYFGENAVGNETERNLTNLASDSFMNHISKIIAVHQARYSDVYLYYLTKEPAQSYANTEGFPEGSYGVAHADELQFLFPYKNFPEIPTDSEYYNYSKMMIKIWAEFAANGKTGEDWKQIKPEENYIEWFQLDDITGMTDTVLSRMLFWDQFIPADINHNRIAY